MCGIFAYGNYKVPKTTRQIIQFLVTGLQRLEYRGYDSAGICVEGAHGPVVVRKVGNVAVLSQAALTDNLGNVNYDDVLESHAGIAHTRWATHGEPSDRNAHPHASNDSKFHVVHNGIMTNFTEVKNFLLEKGFLFSSDTDTEVIAVLTQYLYQESPNLSFTQLVMEVMDAVQGAYGLVFRSSHFPGELVACKRGSPLIVGLRNGEDPTHSPRGREAGGDSVAASEIFLSSDTSSLAEHTNRVVYLEDDDLVYFANGTVSFYNKGRNQVYQKLKTESRELQKLEIALEHLSKKNYAHFMLKEICEQPESVLNTMRGRVNFQTKQVRLGGFSDRHVEIVLHSRRLIFISCGTSLNSCLAVRPLFDELLPLPVMVENSSDFLDRSPHVFRDDVCVFVSQSGETADTLRALEYCKERGATLIGFTNAVGSSISRLTDFGAHLNAGVEVGVASTKAYTSQIVVLILMALLLSEDSKKHAARRDAILEGLSQLSANIATCLQATHPVMRTLANKLLPAKSVIVLGRGYQYASCLESALKIKELTYVHTEGINSGELKHGPLALIDENLPVIIFCTMDSQIDRARSAIQQIRARKGRAIAVVSGEDKEVEDAADERVQVPATLDCLQCIVNIIPMQLLAYELAVLRGNNVDCPRNLAKSVTTQ